MSKKIILATGARTTGKSTFLAGIVPATKESWEQTFVFDTEDSWNDLVEKSGTGYRLKDLKLKVGEYVRAYDRFKPDQDLLKLIAQGKLPWVSKEQKSALIDYYKYFIETLDKKLSDGKFKYVFVDTIEPIEAGLSTWAEMNPNESGWSRQRAFGKLETEAIRPLYENMIESIGRRGVEYVGLTSHLRQPWLDNKPLLNKVEPGGRLKLLSRIAYLMIWLVHETSNEDGAPAGLVLKSRISKLTNKDGKLSPRRILPERLPHASWTDIENYLQHPANFTQPQAGERMDENERQMISEMLNDEQMRLMILSSEIEERQMAQAGIVQVNQGLVELPKPHLPKLPEVSE